MKIYTPSASTTVTDLATMRGWVSSELSKIAQLFRRDEAPVGETRPGADEVGLLVYVNRAGTTTTSRVTIGAANSGGAGYRLLRVEN